MAIARSRRAGRESGTLGRPIPRRLFIAGGAAAVAAAGLQGVLASGRAPAFAQGARLHIVRWSDFIPEADVELRRQAVEASKTLGAEITLDLINANDLQARITAAAQSGSGADIFQLLWNWPHLYAGALVDVSDIAAEVSGAQWGFYGAFESACVVGGRWLAVPHGIGANVITYRRSWHADVGVTEFPKTWEAWREVGKKLKAAGKPVGQALGHSFSDPATFCYPLLWSFGGAETDSSGKVVTINSKATLESVRFLQAFWRDACDEGGMAWDDASNNRAFHAGEVSATLNAASIYIVAKRQKDRIKDEHGQPLWQDIEHAALPAGPAGQAALYPTHEHAIMSYSRNQRLAREFLRWLHQKDHYEKWFQVNEGYTVGATRLWEEHAMWSRVDAPLQIFRRAARQTRMMGYEGPPTARATQAYSKYLVVDMYARAAMGTKAEDAVAWAERELRKVYEA
jgi:multiple sugar transport system substrate-binding protein